MTDPEVRMVKRMDSVKDCTVADLVDWCVQRDLSPNHVTVTGSHLKYLSPETDEERIRRMKCDSDCEARMAAWERKTLVRLKEKYEGDKPEKCFVNLLTDHHNGKPCICLLPFQHDGPHRCNYCIEKWENR